MKRVPPNPEPAGNRLPPCEDRHDAGPTARLAFIWFLLLLSPSLLAQTTNGVIEPDEIPPFRPAKPEFPPTFWEQHGWWVVLGGVALLVLVVVVWRIIANRPPPTPPTAAETALAALARLSRADSISADAGSVGARVLGPGQRPAEAGTPSAIPDQVSGILRTYFVTALNLSIPQLTNRELAAELRADRKLAPDLRETAAAFLLALDDYRFDPTPNAPAPSPVQTAVTMVEQTEAALYPPESAATPTSNP